jgi:hypothetical protein
LSPISDYIVVDIPTTKADMIFINPNTRMFGRIVDCGDEDDCLIIDDDDGDGESTIAIVGGNEVDDAADDDGIEDVVSAATVYGIVMSFPKSKKSTTG